MTIRVRRVLVLVVAGVVAVLLGGPPAVSAAPAMVAPGMVAPPTAATDAVRSWGTNGRVNVVLPVGDQVYVGGDFTEVVDPSGASHPAANLAVYSPVTGAFDTAWQPRPDNAVDALAVSGGELYAGGDFTTVDGQPRLRVARFDAASGALDPGWAPAAGDSVLAVQVSGDAVFLAGKFSAVSDAAGVHPAAHVARVSAQTGAVDTGFAARPSDVVRSLALAADGSQLFLGGDFTSVSGFGRAVHLTSVDPVTGVLTAGFRPEAYNGTARPPVHALAVDGTRLLVGAGGSGGACAALDATSGAVQWSQHSNGNVQAVTVLDGVTYCGGHFNGTGGFGGQARFKLALVDEQSGTLLDPAPRVNSALGLFALASGPGRVYAGGDFTKVGLVQQPHLATLVPAAGRTAPSAPVALGAQSADGGARLVWAVPWTDGGATIRSYRIYRGLAGQGLRLLASTKDTVFRDTGLADGASYQYQVVAVNSLGAGPASAPTTVTPTQGAELPPTPPRAVSVSNQSDGPLLTWTPPGDVGQGPVTSYTVLRSEGSGAQAPVASVPAGTTSWTDAAAVLGTTYSYRVVALNTVGSSAPSSAVSVLVSATRPGTPVLTATARAGAVSLSWTVPASGGAPIKRYTVLRDSVQYVHLKSPATSYTDTAVASGTTYVYRVRASSAAGNGRLSAPVAVTVP